MAVLQILSLAGLRIDSLLGLHVFALFAWLPRVTVLLSSEPLVELPTIGQSWLNIMLNGLNSIAKMTDLSWLRRGLQMLGCEE